MGTLLQITLGSIYAWSYFQKPLMTHTGWSNQQVAWILSLAICFLGLAAAAGGILLPRFGPRKLAITGILLYSAGWVIGGFALEIKNLALLYAGLGVIGGIGLGLGYVTPVATAAKWFPDKKGFITGMVVMGFGFGALFMSKLIGPFLIGICTTIGPEGSGTTAWPKVFYLIAVALGIPGIISSVYMRNPPDGFIPAGWVSPASDNMNSDTPSPTPLECILSKRFTLMFAIFFCNITAGIMFIGFQSPLLQDMLRAENPASSPAVLAAAGATLIGISSLFNGIGRIFWGGLSDRIGRIQTFRLILSSQIFIFAALLFIKSPTLFGIMVCYILLCYGGGFGTMPSFVLTVFGSRVMAVVYGCMLIAWSMAGLIGPQVVAFFKDNYSNQQAASWTFISGAAVLTFGLLLSFALNNDSFNNNTNNNN